MKFCPVVPEICRGQVHGSPKERRRIRIIIIKIIIRNGAKTISLQTLFGRLINNNNNKKRSKNNKSPNVIKLNYCLISHMLPHTLKRAPTCIKVILRINCSTDKNISSIGVQTCKSQCSPLILK
jgi:hypothetical protein